MKKITIISLIFLSFMAGSLFADTKFSINSFTGGDFKVYMGFNTDWLYGSRGDALRMGGAQSTLDFNQSFTSYNPACLSFQNAAVASIGYIPVPIFSSGIIEKFMPKSVASLIKDGFKTNVTDSMGDFNVAPGVEFTLSNASANFEQQIGFTGFEIMVPFAKNQASIAFARENKLSLDLSVLQNGLRTLVGISDPLTTPPFDVNMSVTITADTAASLEMKNIVTSVGIGRKFTPEWGVGAVLEHYESSISGLADARLEGSLTNHQNSTTVDFNSATYNSMTQYGSVNLSGDAWGLRFGTSYHFLKDTIELGADFSVAPEITFSGDVNATYHALLAQIPYNMDVSNIVTELRTAEQKGTLKMKLPSFFRLTFAFKAGMVMNLNYTRYIDDLSLKYSALKNDGFGNYIVDPDKSGEYHVQMMDDVRLGLNFSYFQIGGGAIYARIWSKTKDGNKTISWTAIPTLSAGCVIPVGDNIKYEIEVLAVPMPIAKTAITYTF